jgi:PhzF family phenazine biosynthesis protein
MEFHEIKAFTKENEQVLGNPATVTIVKDFPSDVEMGGYAKALASPMTTFLKPLSEHVYEVRHFSPDGDECHICGHATMAAIEHLLQTKPHLRENVELIVHMNPKFGVSDNSVIKVKTDGKNIALTMPAIMDLQPIDDPEFYHVLCQGLGVAEDDLRKPCYFAPRIRDLVVTFKDPDVLLTLKPDFDKLKDMALHGKFQHEGLMGSAPSNIKGFDVINRVFLPGINVNEDIACGSGNCSVIPYWATKADDAFAADKKDFTVVYPYPPGPTGYVGGVQRITIDKKAGTIDLAGQASYAQSIEIEQGQTPVFTRKTAFSL